MSNEVTRVEKRGESYRVEGYVKGRKSSFHVPAQAVETRYKTAKDAKAFFERSLSLSIEGERHGE